MRLAGAGVLLGAFLALAVGKAMQALLFGVSPSDGATFLAAASACLATALAGGLRPALRAAGLDPASAIRAE